MHCLFLSILICLLFFPSIFQRTTFFHHTLINSEVFFSYICHYLKLFSKYITFYILYAQYSDLNLYIISYTFQYPVWFMLIKFFTVRTRKIFLRLIVLFLVQICTKSITLILLVHIFSTTKAFTVFTSYLLMIYFHPRVILKNLS